MSLRVLGLPMANYCFTRQCTCWRPMRARGITPPPEVGEIVRCVDTPMGVARLGGWPYSGPPNLTARVVGVDEDEVLGGRRFAVLLDPLVVDPYFTWASWR